MNDLEKKLGIPRQINTKDIIIDDDIQRGTDDRKAQFNRIMKEFDPDLVNSITVAEVGGKYLCTDGQMRIAVLKAQNGGKDLTVPCLVKGHKKKTEAAHMFADQDENKKRVTMGDKIYTKAYGGSGLEEQVFLQTNARYGFRTDDREKTDKSLIYIQSARALFEEYHLFETLDKYESFLYVLKNGFEDNEPKRTNMYLIRGLGVFMRTYYDRLDIDLLVSQLKKGKGETAEKIVNKGKGYGGEGFGSYARIILKIYNYYLKGENKKKKLPEVIA